ncbi:MAG: PD40 domain-containing protein, partial [Candidatus Aminicenantes bacterium]|nr:PD40 domain-containing protein [Candidatus Aminicenantes bacterium]
MKAKTILFIIAGIILFFGVGNTKQKKFPVLKGPYLGQKLPGKIPKIFAPGIISTDYNERIAAFTPDGKELYYVLAGAPHFVILYTMELDGRWIKPQVAPFSGKYLAEFNISPDGNKIVFASSQPLNGIGEPMESVRVWIVKRNEMGWGEPICLMPSISGYPSLTKKSDLYFNSAREDAVGGEDIYVSRLVNGEYTEPVNIGSL